MANAKTNREKLTDSAPPPAEVEEPKAEPEPAVETAAPSSEPEAVTALREWQLKHIWNSRYSQDTARVNLINTKIGELVNYLL